MKKNYYQLYEKINDGVYLHYNSFNNSFLLLNSNMHNIYENTPLEDIENQSPKLYASLIDNQFINPRVEKSSHLIWLITRRSSGRS